MKNYWKELTMELNTLRGPVRTIAKWKQTLTHWKHQVRSRARKIRVERNLISGGPPLSDKTSAFEEKVMQIFGAVAVDGVQSVPTVGCDEGSIGSSSAAPTSVSSFITEDTSDSGSSMTPGPSKRSAPMSTSDLYSRVIELCAKRCQMEKAALEESRQIQLQILKNQDTMTYALGKVGEGLAANSQLLNVLIK